MSETLPGGKLYFYGLYNELNRQIGFICYANYNPKFPKMYHANRVVIHPDFSNIGLGKLLLNETAKKMKSDNFDIRIKFSSKPMLKMLKKSKLWICKEKAANVNKFATCKSNGSRTDDGKNTFRNKVVTYSFKYIGGSK